MSPFGLSDSHLNCLWGLVQNQENKSDYSPYPLTLNLCNKYFQTMKVDPMFMIVQNSRLFLTAGMMISVYLYSCVFCNCVLEYLCTWVLVCLCTRVLMDLWTTIPDAAWQCKTMHDNSWHFMTVLYSLWQFLTVSDFLLWFMTMQDNTWQFMTAHENSWRFMMVPDGSWWLMTVHVDS